MAWKDLLVQIDDTKANAGRSAAAIDLARRLDAHLSGVYLVPEMVLPAFVEGYLAADVYTEIQQRETERANAALNAFKTLAEREGIAADTRLDQGTMAEFADRLSLHGRYADLTIVGQPDLEDMVPAAPTPEQVVLNSGAPVLIIPYIGTALGFGRKITVAWNASRESARAVRDAMPLLELAAQVDVVGVRPRQSDQGHGEMPGADIALHLARHGVKVEVERIEGDDIDVGNALLSHIADHGSDLLVMGGYGHSRLRELVLGGATRTILRAMTVPVLMSH
jgi:nucleotide-binding universal stress UspA family protein